MSLKSSKDTSRASKGVVQVTLDCFLGESGSAASLASDPSTPDVPMADVLPSTTHTAAPSTGSTERSPSSSPSSSSGPKPASTSNNSSKRYIFECVLIPRKEVTVTIDPSRTFNQPPSGSENSSSEQDLSEDENYKQHDDDSSGEWRGRKRQGGGERPLKTKEHGDLVEILERSVTRQGRIYYTVQWSDGVQTQESPEELRAYPDQVETYECQLIANGGPSIAHLFRSQRTPGPKYKEVDDDDPDDGDYGRPKRTNGRNRMKSSTVRSTRVKKKVDYAEPGTFEDSDDANYELKKDKGRKRRAHDSDDDLGGFGTMSLVSSDSDDHQADRSDSQDDEDAVVRRRSIRIRKAKKHSQPVSPVAPAPYIQHGSGKANEPEVDTSRLTMTDVLLTPEFIAQHLTWCIKCGEKGSPTGEPSNTERRKKHRKGTEDEWEIDESQQGKLLLCRSCCAAYHEGCLPKQKADLTRLFVKGPKGEREFVCMMCARKCECEECGKKWIDLRLTQEARRREKKRKDEDARRAKEQSKTNADEVVEDMMEVDEPANADPDEIVVDRQDPTATSTGEISASRRPEENRLSTERAIDGDADMDIETDSEEGEDVREVLFRCTRCDFACHYSCMPRFANENDLLRLDEDDDDAMRYEARVEYLRREWRCFECVKWPEEVDAILTYRDTPFVDIEKGKMDSKAGSSAEPSALSTVGDDSPRVPVVPAKKPKTVREYLVKFKGRSYRKVEWVSDRWLSSTQRQRYNFFWRSGPVKSAAEDVIMKEWCRVNRVLDVVMKNKVKAKGKGKEVKGKKVKPKTDRGKRGKAKRVIQDDDDDDEESLDKEAEKTEDDSDMDGIENVERIYAVWQDLPYEQATWDDPPNYDSDSYPFFQHAYRMWKKAKKIHVPSGMRKLVAETVAKAQAEGYQAHEITKQPAYIKGGTLMKYQLEGLNWLIYQWEKEQACILADDMGLGKTIQIISFCSNLFHEKGVFPFVIVVPNSTVANWVREFNKWAPALFVVPYLGSGESRKLSREYEMFHGGKEDKWDLKCHVVVTTYDTMISDIYVFKKVPYWPALIVDEGQRLKNDESHLFKKLKELTVGHKILLTGTPLQNNIRELFNLMNFLDPVNWKDLEGLEQKYNDMNFELMQELHEQLKPYFLRRTKAGVLKHLPPKAEIIVPVSMSPYQKQIYKEILSRNWVQLRSLVPELNPGSSTRDNLKLNNILMQLRKCLNHPYTLEGMEPHYDDAQKTHLSLIEASGKLVLLHQMLPKLKERGHRVLIFSTMKLALDVLEDYIVKEGFKFVRLDGDTPNIQRQRSIDAFNARDSDIFIFLLTTRAGGVGVNLATADTIIIYDADFNPHADMQALSRAHRIGQQKKLLVFKLMTRGSAEEKIIQLGKKKMILDHLIVAKMDDEELDKEDIESILKFGAKALFEGDESKDIKYDAAAIDKLLDRSQMEVSTEVEEAEEDSKGMSFSFARIWSAEGDGALEEMKDNSAEVEEEDEGFWANILKERAAQVEMEKKEEKAQEITGRGARKRAKAVSYAEQDLVAIGPDDRPKKRGRPSKKKKSEENEVDNNDMDFVPNKDEKEPVSTDTEAELDDEDISAMNGGAGNLGNPSAMDMKAGVKEKKVKKITAKHQQKQQFSQNPPPPTTTLPPPPPLPLPPPNTSSTGGLMGKFRQIGPIPTPAPPPPAPPLVFKQMMLQPPPMPYRQQIVPKPQDTTTCILCMTIHYGKPCPNMFNGELIRQRLQGLPTLPGVTDADKVILADKLRQLLSQAVEVDRTTHRSSAAAAAASAFNGAASRQPETTASECIICNKYHDGKCPLIDDLDALKRRRDEVNGMSAPNSMRKELLKEIDRHITKASRPLQATLQTIKPTQISRPPQDISESLKFMFGQTPMSNAIPGTASSIPSMCHICQTSPTHPPFLCPMISQPLSLRKRYSEIELDHNISPGKKSELLSTIQVYLSNQVVKERGLGGGGKNLTPFVGTGSTVEQVRGLNGIGQYDMEHSLQQEAQDPVASGLGQQAGEKELDDGAGDVHGNNEHEIIDLT